MNPAYDLICEFHDLESENKNTLFYKIRFCFL